MRRLTILLLAGFLASCRSPAPPKAGVHAAGWDKVQTGLMLLRDGRTDRAERAFQNAVLDARSADDAAGVVFASYHLGAARLLLDRAEAAEAPLQDALALAPADDPLAADILLLLADAALRREEPVPARAWLERSIAARKGPPPARQALLEARIASLSGDDAGFQKRAEALPDDSPDNLELKALAAARGGRHEQALAAYRKAADLARKSGRHRLLPGLLGGAAESAASLGRSAEAADLATRAAGSAYGQQRISDAFHWLDRGATFAEKVPDSPEAANLKRLFGELSTTVNEANPTAVKPVSKEEEEKP